MSSQKSYSIELNEEQFQFLERMVDEYNLPDVSKVVRCLVNYVRDEQDKCVDVFEQIRCLDC